MTSRPIRWSYSSLTTFEECPAKWKYRYLEDHPDRSSPAAERGTRLHAFAEKFVKGDFPHIPGELKKIEGHLRDFKDRGAYPEAVWTLSRTWEVKEPAWIKAIVDIHYVEGDCLQIWDYKSGREYPDHREQLELYALIGHAIYPNVSRVEYQALYIDSGHVANNGSVLTPMLTNMRQSWTDRAIKLENETEFLPTPSGHACRFCPYKAREGGPCLAGI